MEKVPCPAPDTVNVPFAKLALPATPTEPISSSDHAAGRPGFGAIVTVKLTAVVLTRFPDVPVTVTFAVPVVAVPLAVSVSVLVPVVLVGLNDAVTPLGNPDADKLTLPLKPFCGVTVIVLVPLVPCTIVKLFGAGERTKLPCGFTVRETVAVLVKLPEVPVTVTVAVPVIAVPLAVRVNVLVPVVLAGLNDAVTPLGRPDADKLTLPLKPFCGVTVIVLVPLVPCVMARLFGDAESEKFGGGGPGVVSETLSKVAVASEDVLRLLTANPTSTFCAMLTVWLVPNCTQVAPSVAPYMLNTFPLLTSLIQYGSVALAND